MDTYDAELLEAMLKAALKEMVQDGKIGPYGVDTFGSWDIDTPIVGKYYCIIHVKIHVLAY